MGRSTGTSKRLIPASRSIWSRMEALMRSKGFGKVIDDSDGQIDLAMEHLFASPGTRARVEGK